MLDFHMGELSFLPWQIGRKHTSRRAAAIPVLQPQEVGVAGAGPITEVTGLLPEGGRIF